MQIIVASAITENYFTRALPFINSMQSNLQTPKNIIVTVGWKASRSLRRKYSNIEFIYLDFETVREETTYMGCVQHGAFMDVIPDKHNPLIIFSDSDVVIQRDFTHKELDWLNAHEDTCVSCGVNNPYEIYMFDDIKHLKPKVELSEIEKVFSEVNLKQVISFNTGNVVATANTWKQIRSYYVSMFPIINTMFDHYAKQQLLLSYIFHTKFTTFLTHHTFHTHGCWELPPNCNLNNKGHICINEEEVLFRHNVKLEGFSMIRGINAQ